MDSPFGPPLPGPDPLDPIENSIRQPAWWPYPIPDPLARALGSLEASVEPPIPPELDAYADNLGRTLDAVEASVESQRPLGSGFVHDPLHELLNRLESEIENTVIKPEPKPEDPPEPPAEENYGSYEREPPFQYMGQVPFMRQYRRPGYRLRGSSTGIRNAGGRYECYCYLHESWVWPDDCPSCSDFEQAETQAAEGEECCRHSSQYEEGI